MEKSIEKEGLFSTIITILMVILAVTIISKFFKDLKKASSDDIVSEEGKDILNDPDKRVLLRNAIDQYHQKGNWDGLKELQS